MDCKNNNIIEELCEYLREQFNNRVICLLYYGSNAYNREIKKNSDYDFCLVLDQRKTKDLSIIRKITKKFSKVELTLHYLKDLETDGWDNFQSDNHGVFYLYHFASAKAIIGDNVFARKIHLIQTTSKDAIEKLREIYYKVEGEKHNLVMAVYGSLARYEMLPMSDMDVLLFADNEKTVERAKDLIKSLNFDYVDVPSKNFINLENLKQFALSNSPDGHVAKLLIVAGSPNLETYEQLTNVKKISNSQHLLLENLIFDYNYLNYRVKQKHTNIGENLKYSKGGTRDNLYFDWAADFLTKCDISQKSNLNQVPQIKYSIPIICKYLNKKNEENDLLSCINFVNIVKNHALLLKKQGGY